MRQGSQRQRWQALPLESAASAKILVGVLHTQPLMSLWHRSVKPLRAACGVRERPYRLNQLGPEKNILLSSYSPADEPVVLERCVFAAAGIAA